MIGQNTSEISKELYRVVTSAQSCNKVGHLFWYTILVQHEANDVILYIYNVYRRRSSFLKLEDYSVFCIL